MLCPGCVAHGLPLAQRIARTFPASEVAVIGLHTVFEHHAAMTEVSLRAFLHEYRISFPVGIDEASRGATPRTMASYGLRGTPSLLLVDRDGMLREHLFGDVTDMAIGARIAALLSASTDQPFPSRPFPNGQSSANGSCCVPSHEA